MIEIAIAILVVGCIIYIFKSDFIRRDVCVTVIESLPLSIFKKWVKEDSKIKSDNILKDERNKVISIKDNGYENIVDFNKEVLNEVAITKIEQDIEVIEEENIIEENNVNEEENIDEDIRIDTTKDIEEVINTNINNSFEGNLKEVSNNSEESIESKEIIEDTNEEIKEIDKSSEEVDEEANNLDDILNLVSEELVFWTPNGKTYHTKNTCRSLSRSKIINSGTVYESGKDFKCENCK
ncbi:hypothetical protein [uncultured Clostridium sp.]|uniref:hypothetical protein n=1 Tax=Clostridium sp. TaxID=1506 RepID=UPI0025D7697E|nr:hypothetical protein [uncultured Clostridium sp.]